MVFLVGIFSLGHIIFLLTLALKWSKLRSYAETKPLKVTVVIPARNESGNIEQILADLDQQECDNGGFEVIIVDDFSEDDTQKIVAKHKSESDLDLTYLALDDTRRPGKKNALTTGIEAAKNEVILTTDADCRVGPRWVSSFATAFSDETQIVAGPVSLAGAGLFAKMQMTEFAGLIAYGAVTLGSNNPSMCSGANLAFKKDAFLAVGGYKSNIHIPTGDDEFLLFDILQKFPGSGRFLKSGDGIARTTAHASLGAFLNQRLRWIGKWRYNKNWKLRLTAVLFFFDYALMLAGIVGLVIGIMNAFVMITILALRILSGVLLTTRVGRFLGFSGTLLPYALLQTLYPLHVFSMGLISIFGGYTWKGRRY